MNNTIPHEKRKRSVKLKTANDVQFLLKKTINGLLRNEIEESKAGKIGYLCNILLNSFQMVDFEKRISELEKLQTKD